MQECIGKLWSGSKGARSAFQGKSGTLHGVCEEHNVYGVYYPVFTVMIGTACRCGEVVGLTWGDVDIKAKDLTIDHQLMPCT